jgi:hypothetical protein
MPEPDYAELKATTAAIKVLLEAFRTEWDRDCARRYEMEKAMLARIDALESWRDRTEGSLRVITAIATASVTISVGIAIAYFKSQLGI